MEASSRSFDLRTRAPTLSNTAAPSRWRYVKPAQSGDAAHEAFKGDDAAEAQSSPPSDRYSRGGVVVTGGDGGGSSVRHRTS